MASPEYLAHHPAPRVPQDLVHHNCIVYSLTSTPNSWVFRDGPLGVKGNFKVNTPDGIYQSVVDGLGIALAPLWLFEEALLNGTAHLLLREFAGPPAPINLVYGARRLLPSRARVFMQYIAEDFAHIPSLNEGGLERLLKAGLYLTTT